MSDSTEPVRLEPSSEFVQSLARGLAVIRAFDGTRPELGLSDVSRATGLTRATARRLLLTLVRLGYVRQDGNRFSLRPRVLELGYSYLSALSLPELAQPHMEALVAEVNESSSIAVLDDTDIVYVVRVPTSRIMSITIAVGTRLPAYPTSMGRVLLAALEPEALEERLARMEIRSLTADDCAGRRRAAGRARPGSRAAAGPRSTRSSSRACARSRYRSETRAGPYLQR